MGSNHFPIVHSGVPSWVSSQPSSHAFTRKHTPLMREVPYSCFGAAKGFLVRTVPTAFLASEEMVFWIAGECFGSWRCFSGNPLRHDNESKAPGSRKRDRSFPLIFICTPGNQGERLSLRFLPEAPASVPHLYLSVAFVLVIRSPVTKGNSHGRRLGSNSDLPKSLFHSGK